MSERYNEWQKRKEKHYEERHVEYREGNYSKDPSCEICYPGIYENTTPRFKNFWQWFKDIETYNVNDFSSKTVEKFEELMDIGRNQTLDARDSKIEGTLEVLLESISYIDKPEKRSKVMYENIIDRYKESFGFYYNSEEIQQELLSGKNDSSEKDSPKNNSGESSPKDETNENEEIEESERISVQENVSDSERMWKEWSGDEADIEDFRSSEDEWEWDKTQYLVLWING